MRNRKIAPLKTHETLTSGLRVTAAQVQDLCIDVSMHSPTHVAECRYAGHVHMLEVRVMPRTNLGHQVGGNDTYAPEWTDHVYLPGSVGGEIANTPDAHKALASLCLRLQTHLPPSHTPGGAA